MQVRTAGRQCHRRLRPAAGLTVVLRSSLGEPRSPMKGARSSLWELEKGGAGRSFGIEQFTRNEQVSGSSPLVGTLFCCDLKVKLRNAKSPWR